MMILVLISIDHSPARCAGGVPTLTTEFPHAAPSPLNPSSTPAGLGFADAGLTASKQTTSLITREMLTYTYFIVQQGFLTEDNFNNIIPCFSKYHESLVSLLIRRKFSNGIFRVHFQCCLYYVPGH